MSRTRSARCPSHPMNAATAAVRKMSRLPRAAISGCWLHSGTALLRLHTAPTYEAAQSVSCQSGRGPRCSGPSSGDPILCCRGVYSSEWQGPFRCRGPLPSLRARYCGPRRAKLSGRNETDAEQRFWIVRKCRGRSDVVRCTWACHQMTIKLGCRCARHGTRIDNVGSDTACSTVDVAHGLPAGPTAT